MASAADTATAAPVSAPVGYPVYGFGRDYIGWRPYQGGGCNCRPAPRPTPQPRYEQRYEQRYIEQRPAYVQAPPVNIAPQRIYVAPSQVNIAPPQIEMGPPAYIEQFTLRTSIPQALKVTVGGRDVGAVGPADTLVKEPVSVS